MARLALLSVLVALFSAVAAESPFAVFAYLPEYRLGGFDYEAAFQSGVTHLLFFSIEVAPDGSPTALDRLPSMEDAKKARAAADKVGGKLLVSLGGNARSQNFGTMATNTKKRDRFLKAMYKICRDYGFDGVDYNWEYPRDHREWAAWGTLMKETRRRLPQRVPGATAAVTFTMYLDPNHYKIIQRYKLLETADYVHCMAYDQPHHHSTVPFFVSGIRLAKEHGFDLSKFTLGLPYYGRDVHNGAPQTYYDLEPHLDSDAEDMHEAQYFNSRRTIAKKTRTALNAGLGGVMVWEIGQDVQPVSRRNSLSTALQSALPRPHMWAPLADDSPTASAAVDPDTGSDEAAVKEL